MTTVTLFCRRPNGATETALYESKKTGHAAIAEAILWAHEYGCSVTGTVPAMDAETVIAAATQAFEEAIHECGGETPPGPGANPVELGFHSLAKRFRALAPTVKP